MTTPRSIALGTSLLAAALGSGAAADTYDAAFPVPALDRWMYPFNFTPGTRPSISTFGSTPGAAEFDSRDGQMLVAFDTAAQVPPGLGAGLTVTRAVLEVEVANDLVFPYDPTQDPWQCFVSSSDPEWQADADAGQPVECHGVGFRNGWSLASFQENSPYAPAGSSALAPGVRNAFAAGHDGTGALVDVSQSPRQRWDPKPFAVGTVAGLAPGAAVPMGSKLRFEIDVADPHIQDYLRGGLDAGRVMLALTSLTFVQQQSGQFPLFVAKENALVQVGLAAPARLEIEATTDAACRLGDLNCDGTVTGADLGLLLGAWGTSGAGVGADLNGDGQVTGSDLGLLLGEWG
jgi:hypothetical protein